MTLDLLQIADRDVNGRSQIDRRFALSLGPSIAAPVCGREIDERSLGIPHWPTDAERERWARAMSYTQMTLDEMRSGVAFDLLRPELVRQCGDLTPSSRVGEIPRP